MLVSQDAWVVLNFRYGQNTGLFFGGKAQELLS